MRLMGECRGSIDAVKRAEGELTEDEDDVPGLTNPTSTDAQGKGQLYTNIHTHTHTSSDATDRQPLLVNARWAVLN